MTWIEPTTGMEFVKVPGGCFMMGSEQGDRDERPVHRVCLESFWMGRTEVTRGQFRAFVAATGYVTDAERTGSAMVCNAETGWRWMRRSGFSWRNPGYPQTDDHPVTLVSWNDAAAFADWLSHRSGVNLELPGEAEWEYACRGNTRTEWFWGEDDALACEFANGPDVSSGLRPRFPCRDGYTTTSPAASFAPNPFGLHDMLGNVWEWCRDAYDPRAYAGDAGPGGDGSGRRVLRGGSWYIFPWLLRAGFRNKNQPDAAYANYGFRLFIPSGQVPPVEEVHNPDTGS